MHDLLARLAEADATSADAVRSRAANVLRPSGALRRLDDVAAWLAGWQRTAAPRVEAPAAVVFVADHGVAAEGVSAYPAEVTAEVLRALRDGAATANAMAGALGVPLSIVDVGVGCPSGNLVREAALTADAFGRCFEAGRRAVADLDTDLLVLGEMGIGNTTAASAVCAALYGGPAELWTGRGTGIDDATYERKLVMVVAAMKRVADVSDPLQVLREVGGSELAAIAGALVEARLRSVPVLLDGFVVTAAAAPLEEARPGALAHCLAGHRSAEPGHALLLEKLGMEPLLDLGLRLGEGSGALAALPLVKLAAVCVTEVATFEEWGLRR
jgi:nicotinate-nucleotide--dimethylbenzimidazole phosphoribosyltransferase